MTQYTLAADRSNKDVAGLYSAADPAVLRLIQMAIDAADRKSVPVNVCGQMSGNSLYTMLLLGMGLRRVQRHAQRDSGNQESLPHRDDPAMRARWPIV